MRIRLFKTRQEVRALRSDVAELRAMLVAHFGMKYTMQDFRNWYDKHRDANHIPVTEGEWHHYDEILSSVANSQSSNPVDTDLSFRDKRVMITKGDING